MIFVPACFNMTTGPAHWALAFRSRALDNQVFMAGCAQARQNSGYISYGHSIITSPWGDVVGQMDEREGLMIREIDLSQVEKVREELPLLKQRRKDVYTLSLGDRFADSLSAPPDSHTKVSKEATENGSDCKMGKGAAEFGASRPVLWP